MKRVSRIVMIGVGLLLIPAGGVGLKKWRDSRTTHSVGFNKSSAPAVPTVPLARDLSGGAPVVAHRASDARVSVRDSVKDSPESKAAIESRAFALNALEDPREVCESIEYPGNASQRMSVSTSDWALVMKQFHDVKASYRKWLDSQSFVDEASQAFFRKRLFEVKLQRPPVAEEPDLSWRGIGVFVSGTDPVIRVGGGFVTLVKKDPARARFELARLIAQGVAPCELKAASLNPHWEALSSCLGVKDERACEPGSYSEAAWAVSTAVATQIESLSCVIPAFKDAATDQCLKSPERAVAGGKS